MRGRNIVSSLAFVSICLLLLVDVHLQLAVAQPDADEADEPTCSLDPATKGDCSTDETVDSDEASAKSYDGQDLTRQVISLTDDTFDELTSTPTPATWIIMFKTNACAICKKAKPVFEELSIDVDVVSHNDRELDAIRKGEIHVPKPEESAAKEDETPKGPVYTWEKPKEEGETPRGPVHIATIDAGWSGRDTTKRFGVDATPTIILLRNEGYTGESKVEARSYYVYRGQRALYPLRGFVLGGFMARKQMDMPPPLPEEERKPQSVLGRIRVRVLSPSTKWAGSIAGKILLGWFAFTGILGLFMRVHNYAWGENADDSEEREKALEREKAQGRKEFEPTQDEKSARRQKVMWEQKAKNRAKFAAKREAQKKNKDDAGGEEDDDDLEGVGFAVKKSDVKGSSNSKASKTKAKDS